LFKNLTHRSKQCVTHFAELPWLPEADKELIMGRAICDWIGWKI